MAEKVAVLLGGTSSEREVSLKSGAAVLAGLTKAGINAYPIDPKIYPLMKLKDDGFTHAFISLHGRGGEDGTIQSILNYLEIPFTGSGVMASAITMDKWRTKLIWKALDLPTSDFIKLQKGDDIDANAITAQLGLPLFVKPSNEGSSVGISYVEQKEKLIAAIETAFEFDDVILLERFLAGPEYTVGIVDGVVLPSVRIQAMSAFYDYEAKYLSDRTQYFCPSGLSEAEETQIAKLALDAFNAVGCAGWGRVDVMKDAAGKLFLLEVNTSPGMTDHSLVPMAAREFGWSFSELVVRILNAAC